jgi:O-antigen/teichoic acid export membrane protein
MTKKAHFQNTFEVRGSVLARNTIYNLVGLGIPLLIAVVTIPVIIKYIGKERFGILSLAWAVFGYLSVFDIGLGQAATRYVAESLGKGERHKVPKYLWTSILFQSFMGMVGALALIIATPLLVKRILNIPQALQGEAQTVFILVAISLPVALVSGSFRGALEAGQRFDLVNAVKIPSGAASNLLPLIGALAGFSLPGIVLLILFSRVLTLMAWAILNYKIYPEIRGRISLHSDTVRPLLKFGSWITISSFINPILTYLDRFMIGALLTVTAVSYYAAPYEMTVRLGILPGSLLMLLFPAFSALHGMQDEDRIRTLFGRSTKYMLIIIGPIIIIIIIFARFILNLWLGKDFAQNSFLVLQILAAGDILNTLANVPMGFLLGKGRSDIPARFHMIEVIFYVPLLWFLIKKLGIQGAALACTIRVSIDMVLLFFAAHRVGRTSFPNLRHFNITTSIGILLGFAAACFLVQSVTSGVWAVLPILLALVTSLWLWALSVEERAWIIDRARSLIAFRTNWPKY